MVKTRTVVLLACVLAAAGCGLNRAEKATPERLVIARGRLGRAVSLVRAAGALVVVYSDQETTSLYSVEIPVSDSLPAVPPAPEMIDRIDLIPPLSPSFGEHVVLAQGNTISVLYAARAAGEKPVLKLASRDLGTQTWTLDAIEPSGDPVAVLPAGKEQLDLFWAAGSLLHMSYPGTAGPDSLQDPFAPGERACVLGGPNDAGSDPAALDAAVTRRGITVYDTISRSLLALRWNGFSYDRTTIIGAAPVHSSVLLSDGRLAVLSWDERTRRLELLTERPGEPLASRVLVTLSEGTNTVAVLQPAQTSSSRGDPADRLLFLYDETRPLGGGKAAYDLSLLAPLWGGRRYRRIVLDSADRPITDFSAVQVGDTLYALVHQDVVKLLKVGLPR